MSEIEVKMPSLGKPGEPCDQCGTPLDADQRYCLNCGKRRGAPRVEYRDLGLGVPSPPPPAPEKAPAKNGDAEEKAVEKKTERDYAPLAAVGGIAVLGLMLLIGVLIGRGDGDGGSAPAPVVIPSGTTSGAGTETASGTGGGSQGGGNLTGGGGGSKSGGGGSEKAANEKAREEAASEGAVEASSEDLEALENETGEQAAKNALNLPDKVATPGEPPPEDDKAPAGGEAGVEIK
ncbi:MAG TPA: zinc ribbon domain-containing protein [Solirubrobacterales bacterium]|nr:zinc ribbon domain-containing protein [Solirubrobacterales bacterium]